MKPKSLITFVLLAFVGVSLGALALKVARGDQSPSIALVRGAGAGSQAASQTPRGARIVLYYFHGDTRCSTCTDIEKRTKSIVAERFADQVDSGRLHWRLVNYDRPENAHFREDFQLAFPSVVLVEESGGRVIRWSDLPDVWLTIQEGPAEFDRYVAERTAKFLSGGSP